MVDPSSYEPVRQVWVARILVDDGTNLEAALLHDADWASESEARAFIERRLPEAKVPSDLPDGSRVYGLLVPARTSSKLVHGHVVQAVDPDWTRAVRATVTDDGVVQW